MIHECDTMRAERFHAVIIKGVIEPNLKVLREVVNRGMERGGVRNGAANGHLLDAVPAMMTHRSKICASEWTDRELEEMIDQLMVPLVRPGGP